MMTIKPERTPARFVMLGAMVGMLIIAFMPDHLRALWFGEFGDLAIVGILIAVIVSTLVMIIKKDPEGFDKKRVRSLVMRVALVMFIIILTNHLLRIFWPIAHNDFAMFIIGPIGLLAAIIVSIPAARRRKAEGL